ncbi:hypothetical protein ACL2XP_03395 [Sodalis sp. RH21]|uniref:hypothetical protein n=1 Tax=unclassified Sodalis (in: enterobacteria) TaxID=2636512 RepID=UPI0039B4BA86
MNSVSLPKFGASIAAYSILDKSNILNGLAKRTTGGSVTRNVLAKKIITDTVSLAQNLAVSNRMLGKRSASIVNQGRSVLFGNTRRQVEDGVAPLVELILQSKGQGEFAQKMASGVARYLGPLLLQDHALERVLVALKQQDGGENVLKLALDNALSGFFGGKIVSATFMSALKRAILNRPEYQPTSPLHHMAAWKLHQSLTSDPGSLPPPPFGLQTIEAIAGKMPGLVTSVCRQLDNLQNLLQLPLSEKELSTVYTECWPSDLAVTENITPKDFARIVMMAHATDQNVILDMNVAKLPAGVREPLRQQCKNIRTFISRLPAPEIKVAQNWSGGIESISANHAINHPPSSKLVDFMHADFRVPVHHPAEIASYFADGAFINAFKAGIDLKVDNAHQSYGRWILGMGNQVISHANNIFGSQHGLTHAQLRQLAQLSEIVDNNAMSLMALSRYLIPESITQSVQKQVLGQFTYRQPDMVLANDIWMKIEKPEVGFVVSKQNGVDIDITLKWPVSAYGKTPQALKTLGHNQGNISSTVKIHMLFNEKGLEKQEMNVSDTHISLREELLVDASKDTGTGSQITFLNRGVLKTAFEMVSTC